ncbi:MAG: response regulator [Chloroflexi bacterium]|nr:response regulator [Chloroflexota bacterium]
MATKILVVDDDVDSLKLIGLMLQRQGYEVNGANSGSQAIERAVAEQPDLIILDVMMPDMDGYTVCRQLRENQRTRGIPIIMFTAKTLIDDKVAGFEAGADDYLTKPTHPAELASRVKAVLARSAAARRGENLGIAYAFLGAKGGVGTTTLATNIGALLASHDTTAMLDLRLGQGSLGLSLGLGRNTTLANVLGHSAADINEQVLQREIVEHNSGMRVLLSSSRPRESQLNPTPEAVLAVLKGLRAFNSNVIVDLGVGLNRLTARVVRETNHVIITAEPNRVCLTLARNLLQELQQIGISDANIHVVIINRVQSGVQTAWQEAERLLGKTIAAIISPVPELAYQATEASTPIVKYQPDSAVVGQFSKLVEELHKHAAG